MGVAPSTSCRWYMWNQVSALLENARPVYWSERFQNHQNRTSRDDNFFGSNSNCNVFTDSAPTCLRIKTPSVSGVQKKHFRTVPCFSDHKIAGWSPRAISIARGRGYSPSISELLWKHRRADFDVVKSIPWLHAKRNNKPPRHVEVEKHLLHLVNQHIYIYICI